MTPTRISVLALFFLFSTSLVAQAEEGDKKFYLSVFHFNVQYVAGGLKGFPDGEYSMAELDLTEAEVEDRIIVESFEPLLDMLLANPGWVFTLEMQGYMVDLIRERHPDVLAKMQQVEANGQAEWVSFHWSDQLFVAYTRWDMERSWKLNQDSWAKAGLSISPVVFTQEGQFGESMGDFFQEVSGHTIGCYPKNLFRYHHGEDLEYPAYWDMNGTDVVLSGRGLRLPGLAVDWLFHDDGEKAVTQDLDPYLGTLFAFRQGSYDEFEAKIQARVDEGYQVAGIAEYVDWTKANGYAPDPLPPFLEGTWQPDDSSNMFTWMGGLGELFPSNIGSDNDILTQNMKARRAVMGWEILNDIDLDTLLAEDDPQVDLYKHLLWAEVSDSTGWRPWIGEYDYSDRHAQEAIGWVKALSGVEIDFCGNYSGDVFSWMVDTDPDRSSATHTDAHYDFPGPFNSPQYGWTGLDWKEDTDFPVEIVLDAPNRNRGIQLTDLASGEPPEGMPHAEKIRDAHLLYIIFRAPDDEKSRTIEAAFKLEVPQVIYTPALVDDRVVYHDMDQWVWQTAGIAAANGLVGLGNDRWIIKDTTTVHVAANYAQGDPYVRFRDDTARPDSGSMWRFFYFEGSEDEALDIARSINTYPVVYETTMEEPPGGYYDHNCVDDENYDDDGGCSCRTLGGGNGSSLFAMLILVSFWLQRRRAIG